MKEDHPLSATFLCNGLLHERYIRNRLFDTKPESNPDPEHNDDLFYSSARSVLFLSTIGLLPARIKISEHETQFITLGKFPQTTLLTAVPLG